jgi:hypothetical protein
MENDDVKSADALGSIIRILGDLTEEERQRVVGAVTTFFHLSNGISHRSSNFTANQEARPNRPSFSSEHAPSAKDFLLSKQPRTDVERIACLAFFLTHFRDTPYFKTFDLAKLNTEAAQPKFSNAAYAAKNASNMGYLAPATKGQRQLSAAGEEFVRALPDREAARAAMNRARPRRLSPKKTKPDR